MTKPQADAPSRVLRSLRVVVAGAAIGAIGRALIDAAVDTFLSYVFGGGAPEHPERLPQLGVVPEPESTDQPYRRAA
jgi:hypothetical protein